MKIVYLLHYYLLQGRAEMASPESRDRLDDREQQRGAVCRRETTTFSISRAGGERERRKAVDGLGLQYWEREVLRPAQVKFKSFQQVMITTMAKFTWKKIQVFLVNLSDLDECKILRIFKDQHYNCQDLNNNLYNEFIVYRTRNIYSCLLENWPITQTIGFGPSLTCSKTAFVW